MLEFRLVSIVVGLLFLAAQLLASPSVDPSNDTYRYAKITLRILGESPAAAQDHALRAYCEESAEWSARRRKVGLPTSQPPYPKHESVSRCIGDSPQGLAPNNPRYEAIFESRWGYPLMAAPFTAVLGVNAGLKLTSTFMTMLGGLIAYWILRILGLRRKFAVLGQALYYASPIGWWGSYGLTDGPSIALSMATLLGALLVLRHRYRLGITLVVSSMLAGGLVRYSSFLFIGVSMVAASALHLLTDRHARKPMLILLSLSTVSCAGLAAAATAVRWPDATESLQETFTGHFARPDVTNPWGKLANLNAAYWLQWTQEQLRSPWLLAAVAVGSVILVLRHRAFGLIAVAVAMTGFLAEIAHPVASQGDRLMIPVWIAAALGLPMLLRSVTETDGSAQSGRQGPPQRPATVPNQRSGTGGMSWNSSAPPTAASTEALPPAAGNTTSAFNRAR